MTKAEEYIKGRMWYDGIHETHYLSKENAIEAINQARKDLIDEILSTSDHVKWYEDGKERIKPVDIFKLKDQIE